jgi:ABC-type proline/glycine betaine transport system substrate-binding protein
MRLLRRTGRTVTIVIVDDLDGSSATETVSFALDGQDYEIDLSTTNADELRTALRPYLDQAKIAYLDDGSL